MYDNGLFPFCRFTQHMDGSFECLDDRYALDFDGPRLRVCHLAVIARKQYQDPFNVPIDRIHVNDEVIEAEGRERDALLDLQA